MTQFAVHSKTGMSSGREQKTDGLWRHLGQLDGGSMRATSNQSASLLTGAGLELLYDRPSLSSYIQSYDREANVYRDLQISGHTITFVPQAGGSLTMQGRLQVNGGIDSVNGALPVTGVSTPGDMSVNRGNNTGAYYFVDSSHFLYWDGTQFQLSGGKLTLNTPGSIRTADIVAGAVQQQIGAYIAAPAFNTAVAATWVLTPIAVPITTTGGLLRIEFSSSFSHSVANGQYMIGVGWDGNIANSMLYVTSPIAGSWQPSAFCIYVTLGAGPHTIQIFVYLANAGTLLLTGSSYSTLYVTEQKR